MTKKKSIYRAALFMGEILLRNGGETYNVEKMCRMFCESQGYTNVVLFVTPTMIILGEDRDDGITFMKQIRARTLNLSKVSKINDLIYKLIKQEEIEIENVIDKLRKIDKVEAYSNWLKNLSATIGSVAFVWTMFAPDYKELLVVLVATITGLLIYSVFSHFITNPLFGIIVATFIVGMFGLTAEHFDFATSSHVIVGGILPMLPGVAITKSVSDLVAGDYISGTTRAVEAFMTALAIGIGVAGSLGLWQKLGGILNG